MPYFMWIALCFCLFCCTPEPSDAYMICEKKAVESATISKIELCGEEWDACPYRVRIMRALKTAQIQCRSY